MKRLVIFMALVFVVVLALPALAGTGNQTYKFNMIGHPNCKTLKGAIGGDTSGGKAVMIPLKTAHQPTDLVCDADQPEVLQGPENLQYFSSDPAKGVKIYFELVADTFQIVDRDACDGEALIKIPGDPSTETWNMYVRVLGKPTKCLSITGYAVDETQGLWFYTGSFTFKRKYGTATWINVDDLFDVEFCDLNGVIPDPNVPDCATGSTTVSVFADFFEGYFWDVLNDGVRLVQVKLVKQAANGS